MTRLTSCTKALGAEGECDQCLRRLDLLKRRPVPIACVSLLEQFDKTVRQPHENPKMGIAVIRD